MKNLHRSKTNKLLFGILGGVAEAMHVDATVLRVAFVVVGALTGLGLILYFVLAMIVPVEPPCGEPPRPPISTNTYDCMTTDEIHQSYNKTLDDYFVKK